MSRLIYNGKALLINGSVLTVPPPPPPSPYITFTRPDYEPDTVDKITDLVWIARGDSGGAIFNSVTETSYASISPLDTEWNWDGWTDTTDVANRGYDTLVNVLGGSEQFQYNIIGAELVVHLITDDRYFKINFSQWTSSGQGGGFSYTREEITQYEPSLWTYFTKSDGGNEVDIIIPGSLELTRGDTYPIFNRIYEQSTYSYIVPANTEWNSDGWDDLSDITERTYDTLYTAIGNNYPDVVGQQMVMHAITDDRYWKIQFTHWTQGTNQGGPGGGGFAYKRLELVPITPPVPLEGFTTFIKTDDGAEIDYITDLVWLTRSTEQPIFNSYSEISYSTISPEDTEWNSDGWNDLSDVNSRVYDTFTNTLGEGNIGSGIGGDRLVMHAITDDKYYQIIFFSWTAGGNGGGFSYLRKEIIQDISMILQITTTSDNQSIVLPHINGYDYDYMVDYGDDTPLVHVTTYNPTSHEYLTMGNYTLKISGLCETFDTNSGDGSINTTIIQVLQWGNVGLKKVSFYGCNNLTSLGIGGTSLALVSDFSNFAKYCTSLTSIPSTMFSNSTSATIFTSAFEECTSLTSIPSTLFDNNTSVTDFSYTFKNCTSLTSIPSTLFDNNTEVVNFSYTFNNCTSLTGSAPLLWDRTSEPIGTDCFSGCTSLDNYAFIPVSWGGLGQIDTRFRIELIPLCGTTEVTIPTLEQSGVPAPYVYDYVVDWGDGSPTTHITSWNDVGRSHSYSSPLGSSAFVLSISGICETLNANNDPDFSPYVTKVLSWGNVGLKDIHFTSCHNLTSIASDSIGGLSLVTSFFQSFYNCTSLTTIPSGLFQFCTNAIDFSSTLSSCPITSIPSGLFDNCVNAEYFYNTFAHCVSLTSIPSGLFYNCPNVTSFSGVFYNCTSLTSIPIGLFDSCPNAENFSYTFSNCESLTSIPSGLFDNCPNVTTFEQTFRECTSLTGSAPELWTRVPEPLGSYCFLSDTLLTDYVSIPISWGGLGIDPSVLALEVVTLCGVTSITIPHLEGYVYNYVVDYGDGTELKTVTSYDDENCSHTYTSSDTFIIKISGICETINATGTFASRLRKIINWGNVGLKELKFTSCQNLISLPTTDSLSGLSHLINLDDMFYQCNGLTSIPSHIFDKCVNVNSAKFIFYQCNQLTTLPVDLFRYCTGITDFESAFSYTNLTGFTNLFKYTKQVTNFKSAFEQCTNLVSIPPNLFSGCTLATNFESTFFNCTSLLSPSSTLFNSCYNANNFNSTFRNCNAITTIPSGLFDNCVNAIDFTLAFNDCLGLTSIPSQLFSFCTGATSFDSTFAYCYNLSILPDDIFNGCISADNFSWVFRQCPITSIPPNIFSGCTSATNFNGAFYDTNITSIPSTLFDDCISVLSFDSTFASCPLTEIPSGLFDHCYNTSTFSFTFNGCTNLETIPSNLFDNCTDVISFNAIFSICYNLSSIPSGLFDYNTEVNYFGSAFYNCNGLTSIPSGLFDYCSSVVSFESIFEGCSSLTLIPSGLFDNCIDVTSFSRTFYGCVSLTSIPSGIFDNCTMVTNFNKSFYNCTELSGAAPELWNRTSPIPSGLSCFTNDSGLTNYQTIPLYWGGLGFDPNELVIQIATVGTNRVFTIPHDPYSDNYTYNYTVNWGDGSSSVVTGKNDNHTHTYDGFGTYSLTISGTCGAFSFYQLITDSKLFMKKVLNWGSVGLQTICFDGCSNLTSIVTDSTSALTYITNLQSGFRNCSKLTEIPTGLFNYATGMTNFTQTFMNCSGLTSIPSGLFDYCTEVTDFYQTFACCTGVTSIPSGLFDYCTKANNFFGTFYLCTLITTIPTDLFEYNVDAQNFSDCFGYCYKLSSIPSGLFDTCTEVTDFSNAFRACYVLSSIPTDLFRYNTKVTTFYQTFLANFEISSIPTDLFRYNTGVTSFNSTFVSCTGLTSIPLTLFDYNTNVTDFTRAFSNCGIMLTGNAPELWNRTNPTPDGTQCFKNDTNLTNYASILGSWK